MKSAIVLALMLLGSWANAQDELNCWDESFKYTRAIIKEDAVQYNLYKVSMSSEDQSFLKPFANSTVAGWGQGEIQLSVDKRDCKHTDPRNKSLIDCESQGGVVSVTYDEVDFRSRKMLTLYPKKVSLVSSSANGMMTVKLTVVPESGTGTLEATMTFREGSHCPGNVD